jgi:hypothetical protein
VKAANRWPTLRYRHLYFQFIQGELRIVSDLELLFQQPKTMEYFVVFQFELNFVIVIIRFQKNETIVSIKCVKIIIFL